MKILVVGGGTAGLVTATLLKKKLDAKVDIVRSEDIGIVGVGEGSTEQFKDFLDILGIDQYHFIRETNSTLKLGITFDGWNPEKKYAHSLGVEYSGLNAQYPYTMVNLMIKSKDLYPPTMRSDTINRWFLNRRNEWPANQFHFNTHLLGEYLINVAQHLGCMVFNDEVVDVVLNSEGEISRLVGKNREYKYDFYVDATGFKRALIGRLGAKWKSFSEFMRMNSAITFQSEHDEQHNFPISTLAKAMKSGWMFRLPTWDHVGNGYIYDKEFIDEDGAKREMEELLGREITIGKKFSFDPGYLEESWIKNCFAVGLSAAFVEPLEATSIGTSIQQALILSQRIMNYDQGSIDKYNKQFDSIMENIRDFIVLHYITPRRDTNFWRAVAEMPIPNDLSEKMKHWKHHAPIIDDFYIDGASNYNLFSYNNFFQVLDGLGHFDKKSIKKEYMLQSKELRDLADDEVKEIDLLYSSIVQIPHKMHIQMIREFFL